MRRSRAGDARQRRGFLPRPVRLGPGRRRQGVRHRLLHSGDCRLAHAGAGLYRADLPHAAGPGPLHPARRHHRPRADRRDRRLRALLQPRRDRGRSAGREGARDRLGGRPVELFFIEIQGSGELRLPDGSVMRIGYDNQNGRDYVAIGRLLRERGLLPPGGANMESIKAWIRANPDQGRALMRENLSYIFFKELTGPPLGSLGLADHAARNRRHRPEFRAARCAGVPDRGPARSRTASGSRRMSAARSRAATASIPSGAAVPRRPRPRAACRRRGRRSSSAQGHGGACARSALRRPTSGRG